jgi:hypothetical protein
MKTLKKHTMNRLLFNAAFLLGAAAVVWAGSGILGSDNLALAVILVIACVYALGFIELLQFRRATATLSTALDALGKHTVDHTPVLDEWLATLHPSLQNPVRARIESERVGLPAPVVTPYLVGLLVMLGLLGTFVGMVDTLHGAVFALEGTTELQAIRAGLTAPIKGLSLAFGTSVAGVSASAMLGLISTLSRRDRMIATRRLDTAIATGFREYSLAYNRQLSFQAAQTQAAALPDVAERLNTLADKLEHMGEALGDKLISNQDRFHDSVNRAYVDLATSVDKTLKESLAESGRQAGDSIRPVLEEAMIGINRQSETTQQQLLVTVQEHLGTLSGRFVQTSEEVAAAWREGISAHEQSNENLILGMHASVENYGEKLDKATVSMLESFDRNSTTWVERIAGLEASTADHLASLGRELEAPMTRMIHSAEETPRAAAELMEELRSKVSDNIERENRLLDDRRGIMEELTTVSDSLARASVGQHEAVQKFVSSSTEALQDVGTRFTNNVDTGLDKVSVVADEFAGSAVQMSSLGDAFAQAVSLFNESNGNLIEQLARMEESMARSAARSDEQMGYYVAQAREIIDQSLLSQRDVFDELQQLGSNGIPVAAEVG